MLGCLNTLCYQDASLFFAEEEVNSPNSPCKQIIAGEPIPTYQAGLGDLTQFYWFENEGDFIDDAVAFGSNFTPSISNIAEGTHTFWIADANAISDPPCKSPITLDIMPNPDGLASIKLKVLLNGPYNTTTDEMRTVLRADNLIPTSQPFNTSPWFYTGIESVPTAGSIPIDAVDWVLIEARDVNDNFIILDSKAAFILKNGTVVDANNPSSGQVIFNNIAANQSYYIVVRARMQLDVISSMPVLLPNTTPYDFTNPSNVLNGMTQLFHLEDNLYGLKGGDFDHNGIITVTDYNYFKTFVSLIREYNDGDVNRDGNTTVTDYNVFRPNISAIGLSQIRFDNSNVGTAKLHAKMILEGAYNSTTGLMQTTLRQNNLIPTNQPFNVAPWNYAGTESVANSADIPTNVVDWILLEVRDAENNFNILKTKAAFLLEDGNIVDVDNNLSTEIIFDGIANNLPYYVVVKTRTHIGIMSNTAISLNNGSTIYDFTNPANVSDGNNMLTLLEDGNYGVKAGDVNHNGIINTYDEDAMGDAGTLIGVYNSADINHDRNTTVTDFSLWDLNNPTNGVPQVRYNSIE